MIDIKTEIDHFLNAYANRFNKALKIGISDVEGTADSFAEHFIEANPNGVTCGKNDDNFRLAIPKGYAFYKSIGITSMNILSKEITLLNNHHTMAKVHWQSAFTRKDNSQGEITFEVIYFIQSIKGEHKIFGYITGDEQKGLKEAGLI